MSSSDTDGELLLFTRDNQRGILEVVKDEVGLDLSEGIEEFSASLVTSHNTSQASSAAFGQVGSATTMSAGGTGAAAAAAACPPLPASTPSVPAVPAVNRWPGLHAFSATVCQRGGAPADRRPPYAYSTDTGKLYTDLMAAVPFRFAYRAVRDPRELQIRALPVYCEAQHVQTPVRRCAVHRDTAHPSNRQVQHVRHVLRAQHIHARYDEHGERCSIVVPLEPLEPATTDYAVLFEFTCMNTCVGGMNRRRLQVVFTLEERSSGRVLGRQALEVKVCKCPHRDYRADEKRRCAGLAKQCKRARPSSPAPETAAAAGRLVVTADDEAMYRALVDLRDSLRRYRRSVSSPLPAAGEGRQ